MSGLIIVPSSAAQDKGCSSQSNNVTCQAVYVVQLKRSDLAHMQTLLG